jgi:WD40 repeat protein
MGTIKRSETRRKSLAAIIFILLFSAIWISLSITNRQFELFPRQSKESSSQFFQASNLKNSKLSCRLNLSKLQKPTKLNGIKGYPNLAFSSDSQLLAATDGSGGSGLMIWNLSTGNSKQIMPRGWFGEIEFSRDSTHIAVASSGGTTFLIDHNTQDLVKLAGHKSGVNAISFSPHSEIATSSSDNTVRIWNLQGHSIKTITGKKPKIFGASSDKNPWIDGVTWSSSGKFLVANLGKSIKIWHLPDYKVATLEIHQDQLSDFIISPDETKLGTASNDGTATLWDMSGKELAKMVGHTDSIADINFSSDGKKVLTASDDKTAILWNLDGKILSTFKGHEQSVKKAVFSHDGKCVFTSSMDNTLRIWDISGQEIDRVPGSFLMLVSPNGQYLATPLNDTITVWKLDF